MDSHGAVYVGDAERDIEAGRAARMTTISAAWGYITPEDSPAQWGADAVIEHPNAFLHWLDGRLESHDAPA